MATASLALQVEGHCCQRLSEGKHPDACRALVVTSWPTVLLYFPDEPVATADSVKTQQFDCLRPYLMAAEGMQNNCGTSQQPVLSYHV